MFRLPDLPNAGYQTIRERQLSDEIMVFMREVERKRPLLLDIVIAGPDVWRTRARDVWRGLRIDDELIDGVYRYFTLQAAWPRAQRAMIDALNANDVERWRKIVKAIMPRIEADRERLKSLPSGAFPSH